MYVAFELHQIFILLWFKNKKSNEIKKLMKHGNGKVHISPWKNDNNAFSCMSLIQIKQINGFFIVFVEATV